MLPHLFLIFRRRHWQHYRHQLRQVDMRRTLLSAILYLSSVFILHSWAMVAFEDMAADDAMWLTLTTALTVGYGDYAAATALGRLSTVILIYVGGVFVLFNLAGDYFEFRAERKLAMIKGRWRWQMEDHVLVLNSPSVNTERYVLGLVRELRRGRQWCDCPVLLLCKDYGDGLPEAFKDVGVVHYHGEPTDPDDLIAADAAKASIVIVLAEHADDKRSDEITFDILARLDELDAGGLIVAECVRTVNRDRLRRVGADIVLRPIRFYPEIVVRAINSPGSEVILENLFTVHGDECIGFHVPVTDISWVELVTHLMGRGLGTAIAYADAGDGAIVCNPPPDTAVDARAIFLIVKEGRKLTEMDVRAAIDQL